MFNSTIRTVSIAALVVISLGFAYTMLGGSLGSIHDDLLNAKVDGDDARKRLIEALKDRAESCIKSGNYPDASRLYNKGIEVALECVEMASSEIAILYANKSMCEINMNCAEKALSDANKALELDPTYAKAYYRKAVACVSLGKLSDAKTCLENGLQVKEGDKELQSQLEKVNNLIKAGSSKPKSSTPAKTVSTTVTTPSNRSAVKSGESSSKIPTEEDEEDSKVLGTIRGYKKTSDGRATTFFNREIDETTKSLIGDIAPKKVEVENADSIIASAAAMNADTKSASAWNAAGTWEERVFTPWFTDRLEKSLTDSLNCVSISDSITVTVDKVENVKGDAQITMMRGKRKHIYDYTADINFTVLNDGATITGVIQVRDITADLESEIEFKITGSLGSSTEKLKKTMEQRIRGVLRDVDNEFKSK